MKSAADLAYYWTCVMRAEEDAMQKTRPWKRLEFVSIHDQKKVVPFVKGECLHKDYAFGKSVDLAAIQQLESIEDEMKTLVTLRYPFGPSIQPRGIESKKWKEAFEQANVHLLGGTHNELNSKLRVEKLIEAAQPDIVMVELNRSKMELLMTDEELEEKIRKPFNEYLKEGINEFDKMPGRKFAELSWFERRERERECKKVFDHNQKKRHEWRNSEFRAALDACRKVPGCAGLILGDKQSRHATEIVMAFEERQKLWKWSWHEGRHIVVEKADLDDFNQRVVADRDRHMVSMLHTLLHRLTIEKLWASQRKGVDFEPVSAVAVVGLGHVKGMEEKWAKPEEVYGVDQN